MKPEDEKPTGSTGADRVLEHDCARADHLFALEEVPDADALWLAAHLDRCQRCSAPLEKLAAELAPHLVPAADGPGEEFFARQQGAIQSVIRTATEVQAPSVARVVSLDEARLVRGARAKRRAIFARPWVRYAIAAGVVAAVSVNYLPRWTPSTVDLALMPDAQPEPAPDLSVVAANDAPDPPNSATERIEELSDEELDELEEVLGSDWG